MEIEELRVAVAAKIRTELDRQADDRWGPYVTHSEKADGTSLVDGDVSIKGIADAIVSDEAILQAIGREAYARGRADSVRAFQTSLSAALRPVRDEAWCAGYQQACDDECRGEVPGPADRPYGEPLAPCPRCGGVGEHQAIHVRHPQGGGGSNIPCPGAGVDPRG